jgi:hypothetical protein
MTRDPNSVFGDGGLEFLWAPPVPFLAGKKFRFDYRLAALPPRSPTPAARRTAGALQYSRYCQARPGAVGSRLPAGADLGTSTWSYGYELGVIGYADLAWAKNSLGSPYRLGAL